jgi:hypothetical protein
VPGCLPQKWRFRVGGRLPAAIPQRMTMGTEDDNCAVHSLAAFVGVGPEAVG